MDLTSIDKLMIVAHPDDESLFGGGALLKEKGWLVICVTNGDNEMRRKEFESVMEYVGAEYEIWDYEDKWNGDFDRPELVKDLQRVIGLKQWKKIVTHNLDGEYGHTQHKALSEIVHNLVKTDLYVFGKPEQRGELLPFAIARKKYHMLGFYASQEFVMEEFREAIPYERIKRVK